MGTVPDKQPTYRFVTLALAAAVTIALSVGAQAAEKQPASVWDQPTLTGDWDGARSAFKAKGIEVTLNYIGETLALLSGGVNRRASYEGRLEFSVDTDLDKLIGWKGATTHFTIYQIHNSGHTAV